MSLILCNSDIIFRITFIIKLQTSCGAIVTLSFSGFLMLTTEICEYIV